MLGVQVTSEENAVHGIPITLTGATRASGGVDLTNLPGNDTRSLQTPDDFGGLLLEGPTNGSAISILPWGDSVWIDFSIPDARPVVFDFYAVKAVALPSTGTAPTRVTLARKPVKVY